MANIKYVKIIKHLSDRQIINYQKMLGSKISFNLYLTITLFLLFQGFARF